MERQQTIEKLKRDKTLKNYVLWLIKAKERLPNIPPFLLPKVDLYALSGEVFQLRMAIQRLDDKLLEHKVRKQDIPYITHALYQYYSEEMGVKNISNSTPELLVMSEYCLN